MHNLRSDINISNAQYENAQAELKHVLALMTQFNESGQRDAAQFHSEIQWDSRNPPHRDSPFIQVPNVLGCGHAGSAPMCERAT